MSSKGWTLKWGKRKPSTPPPTTVPNRIRFASDNFNYDLTLDKQAPYLHNPVANLGVHLGSGPMMFFVGSMGDATAALQAQAQLAAKMSPEIGPTLMG